MKIPAELLAMGILGGVGDDEAVTNDEADVLDGFLAEASLRGAGIDADKIAKEISPIDQRAAGIYTKIAKASEKTEPSPVSPANASLAKRDPSAGYRQFYKDGLALGKSAEQTLNEWLAENPDHNPHVEEALRQVLEAEFA
jgi:hypothetical protein